MDSIGKEGLVDYREFASIWRIYMPADVDREAYIKTCFLTGTVTLINDNSEIFHKIKIGKLTRQLIKFPVDTDSLGSEVICVKMPYSGELRIIDVYDTGTEYTDQKEDQYRLVKSNDNGFAEIRIDANGKIIFTVDSEEQSEILISVTNKDREGKFTLNVNGDFISNNDGTTTFKTSKNILLEQVDENGSTKVNVKKDEVRIDSKKILLNDSEEPILLGKKTIQFLSDLLDQLGKESAGPYPLLGNSLYIQMKQKLESLKSTISFVK